MKTKCGVEFQIDDADLPLVTSIPWLHSKGYIMVGDHYLHRLIMGLPPCLVDHENGDKTNCRRRNLRLATRAQNLWNRGKAKHNRSGFKGVYLCSTTGRYRAEIRANGKVTKIGRFDTAEQASAAYQSKACELHGAFAFNGGCGEV